MVFSIFILFDGNCKEAVGFYAQAFGKETGRFMTFAEGPPEQGMTEEDKQRIMYTDLEIGGTNVMFCDMPSYMEFVCGNNISPMVILKDEAEVREVFGKLAEGGSVDMELQETFWSKLYGMLTDKYGVTWQLSYDDGIKRNM